MKKRMFIIRIAGHPNGQPSEFDGQYLETYNQSFTTGQIAGTFTDDLEKAMVFATSADAFKKWREPHLDASGNPIIRPDGREDRPLTAFNIEVLPIDTDE